MTAAELNALCKAVNAVEAWLARNPGWQAKVNAHKGGYVDVELWQPPFTAVVGTFASADQLVKFLEQPR
jgi:hypothetical protein